LQAENGLIQWLIFDNIRVDLQYQRSQLPEGVTTAFSSSPSISSKLANDASPLRIK
jgi:hypothetical protein